MPDRACCDDIVETMARAKSLEDWRDEYIMSAQKWRDSHEQRNNDANQRICDKLDSIESRLTTWVNPVIAVVITVLASLASLAIGALYAFQH